MGFFNEILSGMHVVPYEAIDETSLKKVLLTRKADTNYREVYDENSSGHLFPICFGLKSAWTLISLDGFYIQPLFKMRANKRFVQGECDAAF